MVRNTADRVVRVTSSTPSPLVSMVRESALMSTLSLLSSRCCIALVPVLEYSMNMVLRSRSSTFRPRLVRVVLEERAPETSFLTVRSCTVASRLISM